MENGSYKSSPTTNHTLNKYPSLLATLPVLSRIPVTATTMSDGKSNRRRHHRYHHEPTFPALDFESTKVISAVGRGAKGVVFLCQNTAFREHLALKVVSKALIYKKANAIVSDGSERRRVSFEQQLLRRFDHPLLPKLRGVIETQKIIGYAIDYCSGGNLHSLRKKQPEKTFSEDIIRFFAVELVLALEYLHNRGIVYRDLKPENVMIQTTGHIMLIDFDLSTKLNPKTPPYQIRNSSSSTHAAKCQNNQTRRRSRFNSWLFCRSGLSSCVSEDNSSPTHPESESVEKSNSFVGTEEYVSPEVISGKGHDFGVDWWALGILLYELLYGTTPFKGANRKESFYRILSKTPSLRGEKTRLRDLIGKLLEKDPKKRIHVEGIKGHDFFKGVQWDTVLEIQRPPFIPQTEIDENAKGFGERDVEWFVYKVFFGKNDTGEGEKNEEENVKNKNKNGNNNNNCERWVEGLKPNNPNDQTEDFLVF